MQVLTTLTHHVSNTKTQSSGVEAPQAMPKTWDAWQIQEWSHKHYSVSTGPLQITTTSNHVLTSTET